MNEAIAGKIKKLDGQIAFIHFRGNEYRCDVSLLERAKVGDWILVHQDMAVRSISPEEAKSYL